MNYARMVIEKESPEEYGYGNIRYNLSESSISDQKLSDLGLSLPDLTLFYGEHRGERPLRELVAGQDSGLSPDDVLVTAGAAGALFIISTTLLAEHDHLVVVRPNYATNIETPKAIGCAISYIDLSFDKGFALDLAEVAAALRPNTRYISVTCPHNPTGTVLSRADLDALIALAEKHGCYLMVDETYRDLSYGKKLPAAASLSRRAISVSSLSKAFGIPGIRIGWLVTREIRISTSASSLPRSRSASAAASSTRPSPARRSKAVARSLKSSFRGWRRAATWSRPGSMPNRSSTGFARKAAWSDSRA